MTSVSMQRLINHEVEFCIYPDRIVFYNVNVTLEKLIKLVKFLLIAVDRWNLKPTSKDTDSILCL